MTDKPAESAVERLRKKLEADGLSFAALLVWLGLVERRREG